LAGWGSDGGAVLRLSAAARVGALGVALREKVPVKSITLFIFGGVAQIGAEPPTAGAEFRIAVAGPLVSFLPWRPFSRVLGRSGRYRVTVCLHWPTSAAST